jgi:hypothetical protein
MMGLSQMILSQNVVEGLKFLRRNYLMEQYLHSSILNVIDLNQRHTQNLDNGSCQLTTLMTYSLHGHRDLFSMTTETEAAGMPSSGASSIINVTCKLTLYFEA